MDWIRKVDLRKILNEKRIRMLKIIEDVGEVNQSKVSKMLGLSLRQTRRYIAELKDAKILQTKKTKRKVGNPVIVSLIKKKKS